VPLTSKTLSFATAVEKLESLVKEIVEIDERAHKLGISKEEYALLNVAKKYLSNRSDSDLTPHSSRSWTVRLRQCSSPAGGER